MRNLNPDMHIAAYVRKSRYDEDEEDTLQKHRQMLKDFARQNKFTNVEWFEEVGSGETIYERPVFQKLLLRIQKGDFDAVLCVHIDRLSRGSQAEAGLIQEAFEESGTLLITLEKTYDFTNETDIMLSEFQGAISRNELRAIKRRFREGKKRAVKDGRSPNGSVPYGYRWDKNTKNAVIDEQQGKVYRLMVKWFLEENLSCVQIAERLTEMGIPTKKGKKFWDSTVVAKLLQNEFHLGYVFYGKYRFKKQVRDNRVVYRMSKREKPLILARGNHEPLKTEEEHAAIMKRIDALRTYDNKNRRIRKYNFRLSGLIYCPYCGKNQSVRKGTGNRQIHVNKCSYKHAGRTPECDTTRGITEEALFKAVLAQLRKYREKLFVANSDTDETNEIQELIEVQQDAIEKATTRIERAKEMFMNEIIDIAELRRIKESEELNIKKAEARITELKSSMKYLAEIELKERRKRWSSEDVEALLNEHLTDPAEINRILRHLISRINYWYIDKNNIQMKIYYN